MSIIGKGKTKSVFFSDIELVIDLIVIVFALEYINMSVLPILIKN